MTYREEAEQAREKIAALQAQIQTLETAGEERTLAAMTVEVEHQATKNHLAEMTNERDAIALDVVRLGDELKEAKALAEDFDTAVAQAVQDQLAKVGAAPVPSSPSMDDVSGGSDGKALLAELERLQKSDPKMATQFFRTHKTDLFRSVEKQ